MFIILHCCLLIRFLLFRKHLSFEKGILNKSFKSLK
ncbi:unnamed protein product [Larinioides sclopetarius]|uniref:Uncharacterized protein n=1 Tax=Larinioides sclopetarius TaxID=280406 RepID=A0AAV2B3V2_9ARAC